MKIEERLENLEKEMGRLRRRNRWLIGAMVLVISGLIAPLVFETTASRARAQVEGTANEIRAKRFVVEDENGKGRVLLTVDKAGPVVALNDESGKTRAGLMTDKDGPKLALLDENGKTRVGLMTNKDGASLMLRDENANVRVILLAMKNSLNLMMIDEKGKSIWSAIK